jgi:hypothetical protein
MLSARLYASALIGVDSHGYIDVGKPLPDRENFREALKAHAYAERVGDTCRLHASHDAFEVVGQLGEIDMAVRVDQHDPEAS